MFHPANIHPEPEKCFKYKNSVNGLAFGNLLTSSVGGTALAPWSVTTVCYLITEIRYRYPTCLAAATNLPPQKGV